MALKKQLTFKNRIGDYWKILKTTQDVETNTTLIRIYLFDTKEFRDGIERGLISSALTHKSITVDGIELSRDEMYSKLKDLGIKNIETDETPEANFFSDAEDC